MFSMPAGVSRGQKSRSRNPEADHGGSLRPLGLGSHKADAGRPQRSARKIMSKRSKLMGLRKRVWALACLAVVFLAWWTHVLSFEKECWPAEREPFSNFGRRYQRLQITRVPEDCSRAGSRCPRLQHTSIVFIDLSPRRWMTFVRRALESSERPRGLRNDDHHPAPCYLLGPLRPPTRLVTTGTQKYPTDAKDSL
ncbi:hypothetical protein HPB51_020679 [Rhipicephalus microplus]|uniref:Uncharacterized protein n=1 Tax=Rhipicephalus microplus TaxID=6941 RepID=A0A9J6EUX5_RHIMP|nr:hypothetical protein HPB51_020679 [Rhipicephalus microplus]